MCGPGSAGNACRARLTCAPGRSGPGGNNFLRTEELHDMLAYPARIYRCAEHVSLPYALDAACESQSCAAQAGHHAWQVRHLLRQARHPVLNWRNLAARSARWRAADLALFCNALPCKPARVDDKPALHGALLLS